MTDSLTGLFNRRYFDAALEQNFALYQRLGRRFGVVFLDIDEFKAVNDTHGHVAGDEAIRFLAGVIRSNARKMDIAARYGGDEFAIVCAVSSSAELDAYCRRLMSMLRDSVFTLGDDVRLTLTVSAGASMVDRDDADERAVLVRADSGLYQSKRAGRDRHSVVLAPAGISGAATPLA